jgi:hypothetical protein
VAPPILVTGAHRSGTTWVGAMLACAPGIGLIHEPFNPDVPAGTGGGIFHRHFEYVCAENETRYRTELERTLQFRYHLGAQVASIRSLRAVARTGIGLADFTVSRVRRARPLVKDPTAVFSSEWLASRFGAQIVFLVRHPAAFASSLVRLDWRHDFRGFLEQPLLMRDHLAPFADDIRNLVEREHDVLDEAILLWRLVYSTGATFRERNPDWIFVRHEDLSLDPAAGFASLYSRLELELTEDARHQIDEHSDDANPDELDTWHGVRLASRASLESWRRRLTPEEIERVRAGTADVWPAYYGADDW